ncbi:MAG: TIGR02996 domain-containing protein [Archangium sp.]
MTTTHLQRAVEASTVDEITQALCAAWREVPSTRIAKLARGFSSQRRVEAMAGSSARDREEAWLEEAFSGEADVERLLRTPWSRAPKDARRRLDAFRKLGPDPRIVGALIELDTGERYLTAEGNRFWSEAWEMLLIWGSAEAATRIPRNVSTSEFTSPLGAARHQAVFAPLEARWETRWPREPVLTPAEVALLEQLEGRLAPRRSLLTGLIGAVHTSPGDDRPRMVLADALTEQGDARGEFMSLQFAHAGGELSLGQREKMQRLLDAGGVGWLDGLEAQVAPVAVFDRGFANEVRLNTRNPEPSTDAWSLIEVLNVAGLALPLSVFVAQPKLQRLHSLRDVSGATLREFVRAGAERRWKLIEVEGVGSHDVGVPRWTTERLRINGFIDQSLWWITGTGLIGRVGTLEFALMMGFERVGPSVARLQTHEKLEAIEFTARPDPWPEAWRGTWALRFVRAGKHFALTITLHADVDFPSLLQALASLPPELVSTVVVNTSLRRGPSWREKTEATLREALARQKSLERIIFELDAQLQRQIVPVILKPR